MFLFGALFTLAASYAAGTLSFRRLPLPHVVRFGLGAAILSTAVFLLLVVHRATLPVILTGGAVLIALACVFRPAVLREPVTTPLDRVWFWLFAIVMAAYGVLYLVHAMVPEIQPDAATYHLGLTAEYVRLGRFPPRVGFYEVLPQGLEMLFVIAFAIGKHSAAKLVHFAFLAATVPLLFALARRLRLPDYTAAAAGALYFATPVAGISGTCAYNDAALVFFLLTALYLMLVWRDERVPAYLFCAGLAAGFCYSVKITGAPITAACIIAALLLARLPAIWAIAGASVAALPWIARAFLLTGNPVAPILNTWFPNAYFNAATEQNLATVLRTYHAFHWTTAPMEYALHGGLQGIIGPLLLILPLALLTLRQKKAALLFGVAAISAAPWFFNIGARFLLPAVPLLALLLAMLLPRAVLLLCIFVQAILCWPPILENFAHPGAWMLHGFPWQAALRIEPESDYLKRALPLYPPTELLETWSQIGSRVFALRDVATAYTAREVVSSWSSTPNEQLADALRTAYFHYPTTASRAEWPAARLTALRLVAAMPLADEWWVYEIKLFTPQGEWLPEERWSLDASPRRWEAPWAFDRNFATAWRSRENVDRGMFLEVNLGSTVELSSLQVVSRLGRAELPLIVQGRDPAGAWKKLASTDPASPPLPNLRNEATRAIRRAGFRYILAEDGKEGMNRIGHELALHPDEWSLRDLGSSENVHLFEILESTTPGAPPQ